MLIYIIWQSSNVDTSQMKYSSRRSASLWKYGVVIMILALIDVYQIVMSFMVKLSNLVRLKAAEGRLNEYIKVSTRTEVAPGLIQNILDGPV